MHHTIKPAYTCPHGFLNFVTATCSETCKLETAKAEHAKTFSEVVCEGCDTEANTNPCIDCLEEDAAYAAATEDY